MKLYLVMIGLWFLTFLVSWVVKREVGKIRFLNSFGDWSDVWKIVLGTVNLYEDRESVLNIYDDMSRLAQFYDYDENELVAAIEDLMDLGLFQIENHEASLTKKGRKLIKLDPSRIRGIDPTRRREPIEVDYKNTMVVM